MRHKQPNEQKDCTNTLGYSLDSGDVLLGLGVGVGTFAE